MLEVGTYEAKTRLSQLLERVAAGETITITNRGKAVARLVPVEEDRGVRRRAIIDQMLADRATRPRVTTEEILSARDEGRR